LWATVLGLPLTSAVRYMLERFRPSVLSQVSKTTKQNEIWKSSPGEWFFCAFDNQPVAYYFNPNSVKVFGDSVVFTGRYPLKLSLITQYVALSRPLGVSALGSHKPYPLPL
jgi:hypothetical protein